MRKVGSLKPRTFLFMNLSRPFFHCYKYVNILSFLRCVSVFFFVFFLFFFFFRYYISFELLYNGFVLCLIQAYIYKKKKKKKKKKREREEHLYNFTTVGLRFFLQDMRNENPNFIHDLFLQFKINNIRYPSSFLCLTYGVTS